MHGAAGAMRDSLPVLYLTGAMRTVGKGAIQESTSFARAQSLFHMMRKAGPAATPTTVVALSVPEVVESAMTSPEQAALSSKAQARFR